MFNFFKKQPLPTVVAQKDSSGSFILVTQSGNTLSYSEYTDCHDLGGTSPMSDVPYQFQTLEDAYAWAKKEGYPPLCDPASLRIMSKQTPPPAKEAKKEPKVVFHKDSLLPSFMELKATALV